jgi:hypothetical protein
MVVDSHPVHEHLFTMLPAVGPVSVQQRTHSANVHSTGARFDAFQGRESFLPVPWALPAAIHSNPFRIQAKFEQSFSVNLRLSPDSLKGWT